MAKAKITGSHSVYWPVSPSEAVATWQTYHMAALSPFRPTGQYGATVNYEREVQNTPGWAVLCAIFLFPIGLLALLAKRRDIQTVQVSFAPADAGTWVTAAGLVLPRAQEYLDWTAQQYQPGQPRLSA